MITVKGDWYIINHELTIKPEAGQDITFAKFGVDGENNDENNSKRTTYWKFVWYDQVSCMTLDQGVCYQTDLHLYMSYIWNLPREQNIPYIHLLLNIFDKKAYFSYSK